MTAQASGGNNGTGSPNPTPQSSVGADLDLNTLQAGVSGTYLPAATSQYVPPRGIDNPMPSTGPDIDPQGKPCPPVAATLPNASGQLLIFPTFTYNAAGGYDGAEADFGYVMPDAIPPGGNPADDVIGEPASAITVPGHVIGVLATVNSFGKWQDATPGVPPYGGQCVGASLNFGTPFLANNAPPPPPPSRVILTPPFGSAEALAAQVSGTWHTGYVETLPGPAPTATTYVHIPTCAWLNSSVPTAPVQLHAIKAVFEDGLRLFLVYNLTVTPGAVTWNWGDGTTMQSASSETPPASVPQYDPTTQTWTNPCSVSHAYNTVANGVTVTASESFSVSVTVSWSDGVTVHTAPVPCNPVTGGPCRLTVGAAQGWSSGPHPVSQIEPVPYLPAPSPPG